MAKFYYVARDQSGSPVEGQVEAENEVAVATLLRSEGKYPVRISSSQSSGAIQSADKGGRGGGRLSKPDLVSFGRQLAVMIESGLSLVASLRSLASQSVKPGVTRLIEQLIIDIQSGASFSEALSKYPWAFPRLLVFMVEAGETSGNLDVILGQVAVHYEKEREIKQKVQTATIYPATVIMIAIGAVALILTFVLPQFVTLFESMNVDLPWVTRVLLSISEFLNHRWMYIAIALAVGGYGLYVYRRSETGRKVTDAILLKIPYVGDLFRKVAITRFSRTLAILLKSGVSLLRAMEVAGKVANNAVLGERVEAARLKVREGAGISKPLAEVGVFPAMVINMIAVGEESGQLDVMLSKVADFYESEVDRSVKNVASIVEPVLIVILGVIMAGIIASVMFPLFNMVNVIV